MYNSLVVEKMKATRQLSYTWVRDRRIPAAKKIGQGGIVEWKRQVVIVIVWLGAKEVNYLIEFTKFVGTSRVLRNMQQ